MTTERSTPDPARSDDPARTDAPVIDLTSVDLGGDAVIVTDRDGVIVQVNDAFVRVTGYSRREAIGSSPAMLSSGLQDEAFYAELWDTVLSGRVWRGQLVDRRRDGRLRTTHATISPIRDACGHITHLVAVERDVSAALHQQAGLGSTGLLHLDHAARCVYADPRAAEMLDTGAEELLGAGLTDRLTRDDADLLREVIGQVTTTARAHRIDLRPTVGQAWLSLDIAPLSVGDDTVIGVSVALEDVSERVRTHAELDRRDALASSVIDALPEPIAVTSAEGTVLLTNAAWRARGGRDDDPLLAVRVGDDLAAVARQHGQQDPAAARFLRDLQRLLRGLQDVEPDDGERTPHRFSIRPLAWDEGGAIVRRLD
ncbi:MAG: PAS domain-containing protein [Nitriliruptoraceae bacterium]|nr:PAS domain-containing protein [Nitriliruptoraceae bacterium]